MKLVFVIPNYPKGTHYYAPPIGMGYIISLLLENNYGVEVLNLNEQPLTLDRYNPETDIILTGGLSAHYPEIKSIINTAKQARFKTVLGGGILSSDPEYIYDLLKPTYGIIGEGELATLNLIRNIPAVREGIFKGIPAEYLPFPAYHLIGLPYLLSKMTPLDEPYFQATDNPRMIPMVLSRSCPYSCSFCFHPVGNTYSRRPLGEVLNEINVLMDCYHPNIFMFLDELMSTTSDWVKGLCQHTARLGVSWICQLRVDSVDEDSLKLLKDSGCVCISYGIESINDNVLKAMRKHITRKQIEDTLALTYKHKIGIQGNLIFGTSGETVETARESINWWKENRRYMLNLIPAIAYPGTELYQIAMSKGKIPSKEDFLINRCPPVNTSKMPDGAHQEMLLEIQDLQHNSDSGFINTDVKITHQEGNLVTVEYTCPHCGHRNIFKNIPSLYPTGRNYLRQACRNCNQRADFKEPI
jgi:radical SAM superfamily enzyme YgiQ (UPF0313 family)